MLKNSLNGCEVSGPLYTLSTTFELPMVFGIHTYMYTEKHWKFKKGRERVLHDPSFLALRGDPDS